MRLILLVLWSVVFLACNRNIIQRSQEIIIRKDTMVFTKVTELDTVVQKLTDTLRKKNIFVAFRFDTVYKKARIIVRKAPDTIIVPQVKILRERIQKIAVQKEQKKSFWGTCFGKVVMFIALGSFILVVMRLVFPLVRLLL